MRYRTRFLAVTAGAMVAALLLFTFAVKPLMNEPKAIRENLNTSRRRLENQDRVIKDAVAIEAAWEAHRAKIGAKDQNEVGRAFAQEMSKLYEKAGVDPGRSGEQHEDRIEVFREIGSTVNFRCDQSKFAALLRALDAYAGYLRAGGMTVNSHFDEAKNDMDVILKVSTLWFGGEPAGKGGR